MKDYPMSITAGGVDHIHAAGSDFVHVKSATGTLVVSFGSNRVELAEGQSIRFPEPFQTLTVQNEGGASVAAVLLVGRGDFGDTQLTGTVSLSTPATLTTTADVSLAATGTTQILAANSSRKEALITNLAGNPATLRIGDSNAAAARGIELAPGASIVLTTTAAIYGYNPGGAAQSVAVLESS